MRAMKPNAALKSEKRNVRWIASRSPGSFDHFGRRASAASAPIF